MTEVVNLKKKIYDVYIGRGSPFGNPFIIGIDGNREQVINIYKKYFLDKITNDFIFKEQVLNLRGKKLGCFCKPLNCHGDIIVEWLNKN